jgi:hypothetical protein
MGAAAAQLAHSAEGTASINEMIISLLLKFLIRKQNIHNMRNGTNIP